MTTLADLRPFQGKITVEAVPKDPDSTGVIGEDKAPEPKVGAKEGLIKPEAKAELSQIIQQNSLIFTGLDEFSVEGYKVVKREFTNALGELQLDRQWRGGIVSKTEQKTTIVEDEDGKKKKKRNRSIKRHTHRDVSIARTFRIQDLRFRCRFGYVHITHEIIVGEAITTYCFSGYGGLTLRRSMKPPSRKKRKGLKNKAVSPTEGSSDASVSTSAPSGGGSSGNAVSSPEARPAVEAFAAEAVVDEEEPFDPHEYYWQIFLNDVDVTCNFDVVEDKPVYDLEPRVITLNGYCKLQNFNDGMQEVCYHRHFPRHGHCHTDQGIPRPADIRFWETVGFKIKVDALNDQMHYDDSYFDESFFKKKPMMSDLVSHHPESRDHISYTPHLHSTSYHSNAAEQHARTAANLAAQAHHHRMMAAASAQHLANSTGTEFVDPYYAHAAALLPPGFAGSAPMHGFDPYTQISYPVPGMVAYS